MKDQHEKINGYRDLSQTEIDLMNRVKNHAEETRQLLHDISQHIESQPETADNPHTSTTNPARWLNVARTDLQKGYMCLTRSIAQPTTF